MNAHQHARVLSAAALSSDAFAGSVDPSAFKLSMRQIASPVGIITTREGDLRNGLTATSICSVSMEPPTMLVCVNRNASAEKTIAASGTFAINMLADAQHPVARLFSTPKLCPEDRFAGGQWTELVTGAPILEGAVATFDCVVQECITSGSHNLYIGRVIATRSLDQDILLYRDGAFRRLESIN